jgi:hypothetical protein
MARLMEKSGSASGIHVHCRTVWFVVNCCIRYNDFFCRLGKMCRPSCTFGGSTYPEKRKPDTHHMIYHFCSTKLGFVVSRYVSGTLGKSHYLF